VQRDPVRRRACLREHPCGALVPDRALAGAQLGLDARAHQRVYERERLSGLENQRLGKPVRCSSGGGLIQPRQPRHQRRLGRVA
jgi:hypothetical protein